MEFSKLVEQLKNLNLAKGEFVVVGSGPLAAHGIREAHDFDLLVRDSLWQDLASKNQVVLAENGKIENINLGDIQILGLGSTFRDSSISSLDEIFKTADTIQDIPFINLNLLKKFKLKLGRDKDLKDIELINQSLKN